VNKREYRLPDIRYSSIGRNSIIPPHIFGFKFLNDLLKWYIDTERSVGVMDRRYNKSDVEKVYYKPNPIIIFRRDRIDEIKLKKVYDNFQRQREEKLQRNKDGVRLAGVKNLPKRRSGVITLDFGDGEIIKLPKPDYKYLEKKESEKFMERNPHLKYFAICTIEIVTKYKKS